MTRTGRPCGPGLPQGRGQVAAAAQVRLQVSQSCESLASQDDSESEPTRATCQPEQGPAGQARRKLKQSDCFLSRAQGPGPRASGGSAASQAWTAGPSPSRSRAAAVAQPALEFHSDLV